MGAQTILLLACYYHIKKLTTIRILLIIAIGALSASGQFFLNIIALMISLLFFQNISLFINGLIGFGRLTAIFTALSVIIFFIALILTKADYLVSMGLPSRGILAIREVLAFDSIALGNDLGFLFKISGPIQGIAAVYTYPFRMDLNLIYYFRDDPELTHNYASVLYYIFETNAVPFPTKAYSVFGAWLSDFKIFGLVISVSLLMSLSYRVLIRTRISDPFNSALFAVWVFMFITRSNTSSPTIWALLALVVINSVVSHSSYAVNQTFNTKDNRVKM